MSRKDFGLRHIAGLLTLVAVAAAVMLVLAGSAFSDPPLSGAIFTTDSSCSVVNGNIYMDKTDVYLNGGPSHPGAAGLPDGSYYVQITDPSGATVLGTSVSSANETPVTVSGGNFASCYELWNILIKGSDGTPGYDDSPNNGGEYKVWVSNQADFANDSAKTDNFKVRNGGCGDVCVPVQATLSVSKFYDRNGNGINDDGQPITGWQFNIDGGAALTTPWSSLVNTGTHTVTEANAVQAGWVHSTTNPVTVVVTNAGRGVEFGNYCRYKGLGARTIGYWKTHQAATTVLLPVTLGGSPWSFVVDSWSKAYNLLNGASSTDANVMLKAQLLGALLNVKSDPAFGTSYIAGTTTTVNDVIAAARRSSGPTAQRSCPKVGRCGIRRSR